MCYQALINLDGVSPKEIFILLFVAGGFIFYMEKQPSDSTENLVSYISMLFIAIYSLVLYGIKYYEEAGGANPAAPGLIMAGADQGITIDWDLGRRGDAKEVSGDEGDTVVKGDDDSGADKGIDSGTEKVGRGDDAAVMYPSSGGYGGDAVAKGGIGAAMDSGLSFNSDESSRRIREFNKVRAGKLALGVIFFILIAAEVCINACYRIGTAGIFTRDNYISHLGEVMPAVNRVKAMENGFERIEFTEQTSYNTPVIYNYKGISHYSSTSYVKLNDLFGRLGLINSNAWYVYRSNTPIMNSMMAVKYILSKDRDFSNGFYPKIGDEQNVRIYENPYYLPVGFMTSVNMNDWDYNNPNPFLVQQDFLNKAAGISDYRVFKELGAMPDIQENMKITGDYTTGSTVRYSKTDRQKASKATYTITAEEDGQIYVYIRSSQIEDVKVITDERTANHSVKYPYIIDCGYYTAGESFEVSIAFEADSSGDSFTFLAYSFDEEAFRRVYERLARQTFRDVRYTDTYLTATINVTDKGTLFTSIPCDDSWTVYVDGRETETGSIGGGALISLELDEGLHEIEFKYFTTGLLPGFIMTIGAALAFILMALAQNWDERRKPQPSGKPQPTGKPQPSGQNG
jgi:hypothetical protein